MRKETDSLIGKRFGRLVVTGIVPRELRIGGKDSVRRTQFYCICDCGNKTIVTLLNLSKGRTRSCGCIKREMYAEHNPWTTHGLTKRESDGRHPRLYRIYKAMKQRCYNPKLPFYMSYGGRGITVCDEWLHNFEAFHDWAISNGYRDDLSIDRIDVDGNYCPENCRWATAKEQANNTRRQKAKRLGGSSVA